MKSVDWLWFPLSLIIFGQYAIQHGLVIISKTNMVIPWFTEALTIFFFTLAITIGIAGAVLDNVSSKKTLLVAVVLGVSGLISLNYSPWGFGILFGVASSLLKVIPFSSPMKLYNKNEAFKICPQAAAKNIGSIFFLLLLGSLLIQAGWNISVIILTTLFSIAGLITYYIMPDDKIEGWKWTIFRNLFVDWHFWGMMMLFFFMSGWYYWAISQFMPAIVKAGYSKEFSLYITCAALAVAAGSRWSLAWLGTRLGHFKFIIICTILQPLIVLYVLPYFPLFALFIFQPIGAAPTPNYWPGAKKIWGPEYVGTVIGIGMIAMNLGAGVLTGNWRG
jgi:hypothetical protein